MNKKSLVVIFLFVILAWYQFASRDPKVDHFVIETIDADETVGILIARYNGGDVGDKKTQERVMLLNPHLHGQWQVGQQIQIPVFVH